MFAKENRLTKDKDFDNAFKNGRSAYDKTLGLRAVKNNLNVNRFGILISAKISKKAVERNKLKRRIREILKNIVFSDNSGYDIVVIALPGSAQKDFSELEQSLGGVLRKLKLIK